MTTTDPRQTKIEPANRHDAGKPATHLLSSAAMMQLSDHLRIGAVKYGERNWEAGMSWSRVIGSLLRHAFALMNGEDSEIVPVRQEDGTVRHEATFHDVAIMCNAMFLVHYRTHGVGTDDRSKPAGHVEEDALAAVEASALRVQLEALQARNTELEERLKAAAKLPAPRRPSEYPPPPDGYGPDDPVPFG